MLTLFAAVLANVSGLLGAFECGMALLAADTTSALEHARVRAIGFVMAFFTAVETGSATTITTWLWAVASKVSRLTTAV